MAGRRGRALRNMCPEQHSSGTHINDLPNVCLQEILSRVGNAPLPLPPFTPTQIAHPLQCAVICKQWRCNADLAVQSLTFKNMRVTEVHMRELSRFSSLTHLTLTGGHVIAPKGFVAAAALLAESTRGLQCLELDPHFLNNQALMSRWAVPFGAMRYYDSLASWDAEDSEEGTWTTALAKALPSWKHLQKLDLGNLHRENDKEGFRLLFANLQTLPALESLTFSFSPYLIGPHDLHSSPILQQLQLLVRLKELNVSCHVVPTSSMLPTSALKTLHLLPHYQLQGSVFRAFQYRGALREIKNFESLGDLSELRHLHLNLKDYVSPTSLAPSLDMLSQLRHLYLTNCDSLTSLAPSLTTLVKLEALTIDSCCSLSTLSEGPCSLLALTQIKISNCSELITLSRGPCSLQALTQMEISNCARLTMLSKGPCSLLALTQVDIDYCPSLSALPTDFKQLQSLVSLRLANCEGLKTLVPLGGLRALKFLCIFRCPLTRLPAGVGQLAELERLDISDCPWEKLPQTIGNATSLLELNISGCASLIRLPNQVANLGRLQILRINDCTALKKLPRDLGNLQSLQELYGSRCQSLEALPVSLNQITGLQILRINDCTSLKKLPRDLGNLQSLQELTISRCRSLQALPVSLHQITGLQELFMAGIMPKVALQRGVGAFYRLKKLSLEATNPPQPWLPSSLFGLRELESLNIGGKFLREQTGLPTDFFEGAPLLENLRAMPNLRRLKLDDSAALLLESLVRMRTALREMKCTTSSKARSDDHKIVQQLRDRNVKITAKKTRHSVHNRF